MSGIVDFALEHVGFNVPDPCAMAEWYCQHLGMKVVRRGTACGQHFLGDTSGRVVFEIYLNPIAPVMDYAAQRPQVFHLAFAVDRVKEMTERLRAAGATVCDEYMVTGDGDEMVTLRDPWGVPFQLVRRKTAMLKLGTARKTSSPRRPEKS